MLFLHMRFVDMDFCAFILMSSLPTIWIMVGCLLLLLLLIVTVSLFLKSREVAMLKKEVRELRDTMRMMRYEEANLARMLHTVSKPAEEAVSSAAVSEESPEEVFIPVAPEVVPAAKEEVATANERHQEVEAVALAEERANVLTEALLEDPVEESAEETIAVLTEEDKEKQEGESELMKEELSVEVAQETIEEVLEEASVEEPDSVFEAPVVPEPRKHAINERRPAIPTDLFAAWFAENEEPSSEEPAEEKVESLETMKVEKEEELTASQVEVQEIVPIAVAQNKELEPVVANVVTLPEDSAVLSTEENEETSELSKEDERFRRKLERIVNTRLRYPNLNIDIIAAQLGLGRTNFYRKVRELMGMSPNDYLRKCRMERAAELLCSSELAVSDVCVQVGMPDAQYFSRVFKAHFGISPSIYREQQHSITQ